MRGTLEEAHRLVEPMRKRSVRQTAWALAVVVCASAATDGKAQDDAHAAQKAALRQRFERIVALEPTELPLRLTFGRDRSVPFSVSWGELVVTPSGLAWPEPPQMFALAHEWAHWRLCHLHYTIQVADKLRSIGMTKAPPAYFEARRSFEMAADQLAFEVLTTLGRDALGDALAMFRTLDYLSEGPSHPSDRARTDALLTATARRWVSHEGSTSRFTGRLAFQDVPPPEAFCRYSIPENTRPDR